MHECPECGQACDCIGDDTWDSSESSLCEHGCEETYMDDDGTWDGIDNGDFEEPMDSQYEMLSRVKQMVADDGGTWDLSPNDKAALKHVLSGYKAMLDTRERLEKIVVTEGEDKGVVMLSQDGPTKYAPEVKGQVCVHEHFSPLGDALIEAFEKCVPESR